MNKSVLFLSALIIIAFCSSSRVISYDSVISKLVELNQVAGKDSSDIGLLVSQVSSAVKEIGDKFDSFMAGVSSSCQSGEDLLEGFIKKLEADKVQAQAASDAATADNKKITIEKDSHAADLKTAQGELDDIKAKIAKEVENFKTHGVEAEEKLVVIKTLKEIITDELLTPGKSSSFVQLETFNTKLKQLQILLQKSKDTTYSPLVATLLSLAQGKGFADQKILGQIMEVLTKLQKNLKAFRKNQEDEGKKNIENLKKQAEEKVKQIRSIAIMIADANSNYQDNENIIKSAAQDIDAINHEIERKQFESTNWEKICKFQNDVQSKEQKVRDTVTESLKSVSSTLIQ